MQYFTPSAPEKRKVSYAEIARLEFSGKDRAGRQGTGKTGSRTYKEKKAAGEKNIAIMPEALD